MLQEYLCNASKMVRIILFLQKDYRVSPSDCHVKNRHISASEPLEKLYDEANESYLAAVFAHIND